MPQSLVVDLNQAAINGIRGAGANSQYITPEVFEYKARIDREYNNNAMFRAITGAGVGPGLLAQIVPGSLTGRPWVA